MQRFRDDHNTEHSPALYDDATVREVLARATEIEVESESEMLTARQIETLGNELGLSQEAVRRALGEKAGGRNTDYATSKTHRVQSVSPLTQEQVKAAYALNFWYCLLSAPIIFILMRFNEHGAIASSVFSMLMTAIVLVAPAALAFRSGYLTRRVGTGAVGGAITTFLLFAIVLLTVLVMIPVPRVDIPSVSGIMLLCTLLGAFAGAVGAGARRWWDSLPRNSDR